MTNEGKRSDQDEMDDLTAVDAGAMSALDRRLLGLVAKPEADGCFSLVVEPHLCRIDGRFYGGAALATALASSEAATGRSGLWCTTQLVGQAALGERIDIEARSVMAGKTVAQVMVAGAVGDRLIFQALGATAATTRQGMSGQWGSMPRVAPPEACESLADRIPASMGVDLGHHLACEQRLAPPLGGAGARPGRVAAWARLTGPWAADPWSRSPAVLGFLADLVPLAISQAAGVHGAGTSLDNSLRVGETVGCEWVLLDIDAEVAVDGMGHGHVRIWSPGGRLLGVGGQTARMFTYDDFMARFED